MHDAHKHPPNWTTPGDIKSHLQRIWSRGQFLAAEIKGESLFPMAVNLRRPDSRALSECFDDIRKWIRTLEEASREKQGFGYEIEWVEINHRQLGRNRMPRGIVVRSEQEALRLIGKAREADRFRTLAEATLKGFPVLREWLTRKPLTVLDHAEEWERILTVLAWFRDNPRCGLYLRQLDIPGVDTKFIESRRGLLSDLLDYVLPPQIDVEEQRIKNFELRYGLRTKPIMIRFRLLDEHLYIRGLSDLTIPITQFATLELPLKRVFITENEINGISFPDVSKSLVIFGLGYSLERLSEIHWLRSKSIHYWGDIDTHGFAILDRLRIAFPEAGSFLMDRDTLMANQKLWGRENDQHMGPLRHLTPSEQALFQDLANNRLGEQVRFEQERIPYNSLRDALQAMFVD